MEDGLWLKEIYTVYGHVYITFPFCSARAKSYFHVFVSGVRISSSKKISPLAFLSVPLLFFVYHLALSSCIVWPCLVTLHLTQSTIHSHWWPICPTGFIWIN